MEYKHHKSSYVELHLMQISINLNWILLIKIKLNNLIELLFYSKFVILGHLKKDVFVDSETNSMVQQK